MTLTRFQKTALGIAGLTALGIGGAILAAPVAFYAGYGIVLTQDASLLSELRAPGTGLAALGAIMLAGLVRAGWAPFSLMAALTVYLAFPAGRLASLVMDGVPSGGIIGALVIELAIAGLCLAAFRRGGGEARSDARRSSLSA